ncbi:MAG: 50S ribosomal protein L18 [Candidatus Lokiarchaeota archaeon]|nr:50S ribosomal protein L18 [Candidatus Lokiarchaeota archaeon]MBD3338310.1 50S ribosomal protein L18 [Candidatus Lokiarchaeota archaeon]
MAHGPRYRIPFRRRKQGKTNYHKRLDLLKSGKLRLIIRTSNKHTIVQFIKSQKGGDKILVSAYSDELTKKFGYKANTGNIPAAYMTGYLAALRAKKANIEDVILDLGSFNKRNRVLAAFKGVLDGGIEIPHREEFFPEGLEERIDGSHIENYAKTVKKNDPERFQKLFSGYLKKNKIDPLKISQIVSSTKKQIESKL